MPFAANETNELLEELVGSYVYQIHLHHELVYRLDWSDFKPVRNFCAAQDRHDAVDACCTSSPASEALPSPLELQPNPAFFVCVTRSFRTQAAELTR